MADEGKPELGKYRARMDKAVAALKEEFATLRTGRASAASLLDQVQVEAYGSRMHAYMNQVGAVSVPEPRSIECQRLGQGVGGVGGKSDPQRGSGPQPRRRRAKPAYPYSSADRGTPARSGQVGRKSHAEEQQEVAVRNCPPRRGHGGFEEGGEGRSDQSGRSPSPGARGPEAYRRGGQARGRKLESQRN